MDVMFATYPMAFHTPGGGEVQLLNYAKNLSNYGVKVNYLDIWNPNFASVNLVHYFSCVGGSIHFCYFVKSLNIPLVISSSLWITERNKSDYNLPEIRGQLSLADIIVTNSKMESEELAQTLELPIEKFRHVYNAVDRSFATVNKETASIQSEVAGKILNVANIEPRKNQKRLIEAIQMLSIDLILIGHIRDKAYFNDCGILHNPRVKFLGNFSPNSEELKAAYSACSVFVLPSMLETPGIAALEAAACGAKLVLTSEGSGREYFDEYAVYVDPNSVYSIAEGISLAQARGEKQKYDPVYWEDVTRELAIIYRQLIENT
jgi:glycosyltransferase involved in cell wall biosynthesis